MPKGKLPYRVHEKFKKLRLSLVEKKGRMRRLIVKRYEAKHSVALGKILPIYSRLTILGAFSFDISQWHEGKVFF